MSLIPIYLYYNAFFQAHQVNDIIVLGPLSCVVSFLAFVVTNSRRSLLTIKLHIQDIPFKVSLMQNRDNDCNQDYKNLIKK